MSSSVSVVGLGYVGLPVAVLCSSKKYRVVGIDCSSEVLQKLRKFELPFHDCDLTRDLKKYPFKSSSDFSCVQSSGTIIICVPTPITSNRDPDLSALKNALESVASHLADGALVIIESTISPGTVDDIVKPLIESFGRVDGKDFFLAHCPERIDPGNEKWHISDIPRVVGSTTKTGLERALVFYKSILRAEVLPLSSVRAAEAVKIMENSFRDVNIAFVNELAKSFSKANIDILEVIRGASTKPFGFMPHYPGCGVGGHCIPVDPYYLIDSAKKWGFNHNFLKLARKINRSMPLFCISLLRETINESSLSLQNVRVGILGLSYKQEIGDIRESPALEILRLLKRQGFKTKSYDPFVRSLSTAGSIDEILSYANVVITVTAHSVFAELTTQKLSEYGIKCFVDGRNQFNPQEFRDAGIAYRGIGR